MSCRSVYCSACVRLKHCLLSFALLLCTQAFAQATDTDTDPLISARALIAKQEWSKAEAIIQPLLQNHSKKPFAMYELAQIYENTNRIEAAKQLYLDLATDPEFIQRQPTLVIREPFASRMVYILSLVQARLNAIAVKQLHATPAPPQTVAQPKSVPAPEPKVIALNNSATPAQPKTIQPDTNNTSAAVASAMKLWGDAWIKQDLPRYFASYTDYYRGDFLTPDAWRKQRQTNILKASFIKLDFKNIEMTTLTPFTVQVTFTQLYQSNLLKETSKKTLVFASLNGRWLIEREASQ